MNQSMSKEPGCEVYTGRLEVKTGERKREMQEILQEKMELNGLEMCLGAGPAEGKTRTFQSNF